MVVPTFGGDAALRVQRFGTMVCASGKLRVFLSYLHLNHA